MEPSSDKRISLTTKVLIGMVSGVAIGLGINLLGLNKPESFVNIYIVEGLFYAVGAMFINALKMLVVPLVFLSLVAGVIGIGDIRDLGKVGVKTFGLYMLTTALAITAGLSLAILFGIGSNINFTSETSFSAPEAPPMIEVLVNIVPQNIFEAFASANMLQIIFFSILAGIAILMVGSKSKPLVEMIELSNEVMLKVVSIVMAAAPYAVFALLARAVADLGLDLIANLASYVLVVLGALALHLFVSLMLVLKLFSGLSPMIFLQKIKEAQLFAFSTSSSNATIPVTLKVVTEKLGVNRSVSSFTVPFGATINMDGTAIMQGAATVFVANAYGIDLGLGDYLTVIAMSILASIGTAGVPGVGLIMLSMVFVQIGLPVEAIGLIIGIDRILDMVRTAVNVSGDGAVSVIVAKGEDKLDEKVYYDIKAGELKEDSLEIDTKAEKELAKTLEKIEQK